EARNEVAANGIKGGLSLEDLEDAFGNSAQFLSERGLAPLSGTAPRAAVDEETEDEEEEAEVEVDHGDNGVGEAADLDEAMVEDDADAKDELELDEPAPPTPPAPAGVDPAIHQEIVDTVARIEACYADTEL